MLTCRACGEGWHLNIDLCVIANHQGWLQQVVPVAPMPCCGAALELGSGRATVQDANLSVCCQAGSEAIRMMKGQE